VSVFEAYIKWPSPIPIVNKKQADATAQFFVGVVNDSFDCSLPLRRQFVPNYANFEILASLSGEAKQYIAQRVNPFSLSSRHYRKKRNSGFSGRAAVANVSYGSGKINTNELIRRRRFIHIVA
jgi:hypothetical protein